MIKLNEIEFDWRDGLSKPIGPLNISISSGQKVGLFGQSGIGKSTLLRIIFGELSTHAGSVEHTKPKLNKVYHDQQKKLIPWLNVIENVTINEELIDSKSNLFNLFNLGGVQNKYPLNLSGGQQARVALLRTILKEFDFYLLDEPFSGIDLKSKHSIIDYLHLNFSTSTFLFSSHDPGDLVLFCDKVIYMKNFGERVGVKEHIINEELLTLSPYERRSSKHFVEETKKLVGFLYD